MLEKLYNLFRRKRNDSLQRYLDGEGSIEDAREFLLSDSKVRESFYTIVNGFLFPYHPRKQRERYLKLKEAIEKSQ